MAVLPVSKVPWERKLLSDDALRNDVVAQTFWGRSELLKAFSGLLIPMTGLPPDSGQSDQTLPAALLGPYADIGRIAKMRRRRV